MLLVSITSYAKASLTARADSAYMHEAYVEAASLYTKALEDDGVSPGLLYNLGNTYYKLGKDGEARICYERARKLDPSNTLINQNLNFLSNRITDANKLALEGKVGNVEPDPESFVDAVYRLIAIDHRSDGWAVFAVMAFILFLGGMAMYIFTPNVLARKTGFFSGLVFIFFTAAFLVFAFMAAYQYERDDQVVVMNYSVQLMRQPNEKSSPVSSALHKGTKLQVLETEKGDNGEEWVKVKLNNENIGWLKKDELEVI